MRNYRERNREAYNAYAREWYARPENTERHRETARQSRERRIEKAREYDRQRGHRSYDAAKKRARRKVHTALLNGTLERQPCDVCGDQNVNAHHDDYSKPLVVRWLCRRHHGVIHQRINPVEVF